jgi:DNA-binding transcriptional LysR family regulator
MRLSYLSTFRLVAELGSVSRAAERLWMSQPAVSLEIKKLEKSLGSTLFDRRGNRLVLNERGRACLRFAYKVDELVAELRQELKTPAETMASVTIGSHPVTARHILPSALADFHRSWPHVRVLVQDLPMSEVSQRVFRHELDLGVVVKRFLRPDLAAEPVMSERLWIIAPSGHPLASGNRVSADELAQHQFILLEPNTESHSLMQQWAIEQGVSLDIAMEVSSEDLLLEAVRRGIGLALVGEATIADDLQAGRIALVQAQGLPLYRTIYVTFFSTTLLGEPARALLASLTARYADRESSRAS